MNSSLGGVYLAIVENNKLDERGRIEITIPHSDRAGSYPAHIASFMAGNQRGALFLPEIQDQVLVAFVNGVADAPVIIGSLWSQRDKPPETNADGENDVKLIKTRSGHQVRLVDRTGEESIEIIDKTGNNRIRISSKDNLVTIKAPDGGIVLDAKTISITSKNELRLQSTDSKVNIEAKGNTTIKGQIVDINP